MNLVHFHYSHDVKNAFCGDNSHTHIQRNPQIPRYSALHVSRGSHIIFRPRNPGRNIQSAASPFPSPGAKQTFMAYSGDYRPLHVSLFLPIPQDRFSPSHLNPMKRDRVTHPSQKDSPSGPGSISLSPRQKTIG